MRLPYISLLEKRIQRVVYTGFGQVFLKSTNIGVQFITIPILINHLGTEEYGIFVTLISVVGFLGFADFGLGFGIQNKLPEYIVTKSDSKINNIISNAFFCLIFFSILIIFIYTTSKKFNLIDWSYIFNLENQDYASKIDESILILVITFSVGMPFALADRIFNAFQEGYYSAIWQSIGKTLVLIFILLIVRLDGGLIDLIAVTRIIDTVILVLCFLSIFKLKKFIKFPSISNLNYHAVISLISQGSLFFIVQLSVVFMGTADNFLILNYIDPSGVTTFNILQKLSLLFILPIITFITPALAAFNDALASNDRKWITKNTKKYIIIIIFSSIILSFVFFVSCDYIISIWIQKTSISHTLKIVYSMYIPFLIINSFVSTIMMTSKYYKLLVKIYTLTALITFICKIMLLNYFTPSIEIILMSTLVVSTVLFFIPSFIKLYYDRYI